MTPTRAAAIAALLATVGFASLPASAQTPPPAPPAGAQAPAASGELTRPDPRNQRQARPERAERETRRERTERSERHTRADRQALAERHMRMHRGPQLLAMACAPQAADRMHTGFERMSDRLSLNDEQQALFDTLMTSALTAQTSFADRCAELAPDRSAGTRPDLLQHLETRLQLDEARLAAFGAVLPDFRAFYESLDDGQQANLLRPRPEHRSPRGDRPGPNDG